MHIINKNLYINDYFIDLDVGWIVQKNLIYQNAYQKATLHQA